MKALVTMNAEAMNLQSSLVDVLVLDAADNTKYKKIVSSVGDDILDLQLTNYNEATKGTEAFANMANVDTKIKLNVRLLLDQRLK